MYQHIVDVRNRAIRIVSGRTIVQGNVGVDKLFATFDNVWDGCEIAVIFENGDSSIRCKYADGMDIPHEAIANAGELRLTFVGTRDGKIIVETERMKDFFNVKPAGVTDGADPEPPTPTEYQQLMADIQGIRDGVAKAEGAVDDLYERAANGEFKGEKGDKGDKGDPGDGGGTATDVRIAGESIVVDGVADIPLAAWNAPGVMCVSPGYGFIVNDDIIKTYPAHNDDINTRLLGHLIGSKTITTCNIDYAVKAAMCDGRGPAWTADEQKAARERMGAPAGYRFIAEITTEEIVNRIVVEQDYNNNPFRLSDALIIVYSDPDTTGNAKKNGYVMIKDSVGMNDYKTYYGAIKFKDDKGGIPSYGLINVNTFDGKCGACSNFYGACKLSIAYTVYNNMSFGNVDTRYKDITGISLIANGTFEVGTKIVVFGRDYQGGEE